jgi:hypothetical protein
LITFFKKWKKPFSFFFSSPFLFPYVAHLLKSGRAP